MKMFVDLSYHPHRWPPPVFSTNLLYRVGENYTKLRRVNCPIQTKPQLQLVWVGIILACLCVCLCVCGSVRSELKIAISQQPEELETWFKHQKWSVGVSQHDGVDSSHHDQHQDDQEAQEHPPSTWNSNISATRRSRDLIQTQAFYCVAKLAEISSDMWGLATR